MTLEIVCRKCGTVNYVVVPEDALTEQFKCAKLSCLTRHALFRGGSEWYVEVMVDETPTMTVPVEIVPEPVMEPELAPPPKKGRPKKK